MFNSSDYTLKSFCCGIDLKTATYVIAVAHFIFLNSILYSWQYYTGEKMFWTIIQLIATISLFVGVNKNNHVLFLPWIVVVFPSVAVIIVGIAFIALILIVLVGPLVGFIYCFWCVFSAFDDVRKTQENRADYDPHVMSHFPRTNFHISKVTCRWY